MRGSAPGNCLRASRSGTPASSALAMAAAPQRVRAHVAGNAAGLRDPQHQPVDVAVVDRIDARKYRGCRFVNQRRALKGDVRRSQTRRREGTIRGEGKQLKPRGRRVTASGSPYGYAGTDDGRGTGQRACAKRLARMSGRATYRILQVSVFRIMATKLFSKRFRG